MFITALKLGLTSFGGPIAHLGYFHNEYVHRRKWLDERSYADLVALCQFLPGPASSQVGIGIGVIRGGLWGGIAAWLGFTLPSLLALITFAFLLQQTDLGQAGWIHGLKLVAIAIVAQAILGMGKNLTPDRARMSIAIIVSAVTLIWYSAFSQLLLIGISAIVGIILYRRNETTSTPQELHISIRKSSALICLILFVSLLLILPMLRQISSIEWVAIVDSFYRSGSLVFGGGHVVLPLLEKEVIPAGWATPESFLAGYGATQAVPGPLFTFAGYLGAVAGGWTGAILATIAIFLPAFLLVIGALPFWNMLRHNIRIQGALKGINAAVVGILLAALYQPLWTSTIGQPIDFAFVSILFIMLVVWKLPPWVVVLTGALGGALIPFLTI